MIFFDTESIGYYGPTILIQWAKDDGPVHLHNIWTQPVRSTLKLIEEMAQDTLVGFNLAHDSFHINRTYGCLSLLPLDEPPTTAHYMDVEKDDRCRDDYCVKPADALDLMLYGRKGEFQSTLNQKDIIIRKIPRLLATRLLVELKERVKIDDIYFAKSKNGCQWRIIDLDVDGREITTDTSVERDPDFVNLRLTFHPSAALKSIMESVLGHEVTTFDEFDNMKRPEEYGWWPCSGKWIGVARQWIWEWTNDERRLVYAENDVKYTRELYEYFGSPASGDDDSVLAWAVGAIYWRGFSVDIQACREKLLKANDTIEECEINVNSPSEVKRYLHEVCTPLQRMAIPNTSKEVLASISEWDTNVELTKRVASVVHARRACKEKDLLEKLIIAGRLYVNFKVIGTKSNRMSGGNESFVSRGGSINPQGIKKESDIRACFPLALVDMLLCGGDFDGFEISIAEAEWNDANLRIDLQTGKKLHAIVGSSMYNMTYDEVIATKDLGAQDPNGYYSRAKTFVFGNMYGAELQKSSSVLGLSVDETREGIARHEQRYPGIREARERIYEDFAALRQPQGIGTEVVWCEPKRFVESMLGFKRYFAMEYSVIRALFELAREPSDELKEACKGLSKVKRRDRLQTVGGAAASALYAAAFNLNAKVMRSAANHKIQSPGGQITKNVERRIWDIQPVGIHAWVVMVFNVHDEVMAPCKPEVVELVKSIVNSTVESYRDRIPFISMQWKIGLKNWGEK